MRSPFLMLLGRDDEKFTSLRELEATIRSDVFYVLFYCCYLSPFLNIIIIIFNQF